MPSSRYVPMTSVNRMKGFSTGKSDLVGGAVPLLLKNSILKTPIKGGAINEPSSKSNIMVGTIASSVPTNIVSKTSGGELLNSIQKLKFGKGVKSRKDQENVRFIF